MTLKQARKVITETKYNVVVTRENPFEWVDDIELDYLGDTAVLTENLKKIEKIEKDAKVRSITFNTASKEIEISVTI